MKTPIRLLALALTSLSALAADVTGTWKADFDTQRGLQKYTFTFEQDGTRVTGKATVERDGEKREAELKEGTIEGDKITFFEPLRFQDNELRINYTGKVSEDEIKFTRAVGDFGSSEASAKREGVSPKTAVAASGTPQPGLLLGADVSFLAGGRGGGGGRFNRTYHEGGKTNEEWRILMDHGWTMFRLRVFVSPVRRAPNNSLENTIPLAKRIKAAGGQLLLCLHLSDTWADPQHQDIPVAWRDLDVDGLEKAVEAHCQDVVKQLKEAGAMPDWVQVGNEITYGTLWPIARVKKPGSAEGDTTEPYNDAKQWSNLTRILKAGIRGVKTAAGDTQPRIAIHIDKGGNWEVSKWFFDHVTEAKIDYDIIAQSFYPPWGHGTLEQVWENMNESAKRYNKDFAIVETGYGRQQRDSAAPSMKWPVTPEGRLQFMADIINTVKAGPRGIAVMYWAPEGDLWNQDGSPGPAVYVMDHLKRLTDRPASQVPKAVFP